MDFTVVGVEEIVSIYSEEINDNGDFTMFFQDIGWQMLDGGARYICWGNALRLSLE